ncbi:hypothetical protein F4604DRAFT_1684099 [Suillus subluteus]|nr:hypothetical protein F4604DRAFT_1684099 [Suillus subluteus]
MVDTAIVTITQCYTAIISYLSKARHIWWKLNSLLDNAIVSYLSKARHTWWKLNSLLGHGNSVSYCHCLDYGAEGEQDDGPSIDGPSIDGPSIDGPSIDEPPHKDLDGVD